MNWFNKKPRRRLLFFATYLLSGVWLAAGSIQPLVLKVLCICIALFGSYISLVKADVLKDTFARSISNFKFDFLSISILVALFVWFIWKLNY